MWRNLQAPHPFLIYPGGSATLRLMLDTIYSTLGLNQFNLNFLFHFINFSFYKLNLFVCFLFILFKENSLFGIFVVFFLSLLKNWYIIFWCRRIELVRIFPAYSKFIFSILSNLRTGPNVCQVFSPFVQKNLEFCPTRVQVFWLNTNIFIHRD